MDGGKTDQEQEGQERPVGGAGESSDVCSSFIQDSEIQNFVGA